MVDDAAIGKLIATVADLAGQPPPNASPDIGARVLSLFRGAGLGHSQFNEMLLMLGYDRVTQAFFQYLVDRTTDYQAGSAITSLDQFRDGVDNVRKLSLLLYGNTKFGFKTLSRDADKLHYFLSLVEPRDDASFEKRHEPIQAIDVIPGEETYYLGYVVQKQLEEELLSNPANAEAAKAEERRKGVVARASRNHSAYLASDHLDVYVATSMREQHEYLLVASYTHRIFAQLALSSLRLRWFDPTQAYCANRVDKGLAEALMLKRARCTVYFVQETDTLGKDSELACTLAQGKPVIAFVPRVDEGYVEEFLATLRVAYPQKESRTLFLEQLRIFYPEGAWCDAEVRRWLERADVDVEAVKARLLEKMGEHYDKRARILKEDHPLGIQVNLATGVANGVLVVRTVEDCAELIRRVLTRRLEFKLDEQEIGGSKYLYLRETVSGCIYRVMTGDGMLTNVFWNFYLEPAE